MYNSDTPSRAELPTSKQLVRSTIAAALAALILLVTIVLPAEYGIDPTGLGKVLRMTEMGNIKQQLAVEAEADLVASSDNSMAPEQAIGELLPAASTIYAPTIEPAAVIPNVVWRDEVVITLTPGEGVEVKLAMVGGASAQYSWVAEGGVVNYDTHGDALGKSISYEKGRGVAAAEGELEAAFTGNHGWFWRNRGAADVKLILRTRGDYIELKKAT
jgi:hypothetical protein